MNLAIKNTLQSQAVTCDVIRVLNQMHADFKKYDFFIGFSLFVLCIDTVLFLY
jgi:hypothetical protein